MRLSVIILNYNVRFFLEQCVDSVLKAIDGIDAEVIVVDNNSHDDSCDMIRERFPNVKLIANAENLGFPKGNNIGVAQCSGEFICILNPDTVVPADVFYKSIAFFETLTDAGILGVRLIDGKGNFLPESKRGVPTPSVAFSKIAGLHKLFPKRFGKYYAAHLSEYQSGKVDILVGAFMLLKRQTYLDAGGFDENCFMYSDDIDLSYTVLKSGKSNYYFHDSTVIHYKGESTVKDKLYIKRFSEAMDFFYRKHFSKAVVFDMFLKVGAYFFSKAKANTTVPAITVDRYYLWSDDQNLKSRCEAALGMPIELVSSERSFNPSTGNTEIIFDANYLDYSAIISKMNLLKADHVTFKIAHKDSAFIIGSDSSNDRGQVIMLADNR